MFNPSQKTILKGILVGNATSLLLIAFLYQVQQPYFQATTMGDRFFFALKFIFVAMSTLLVGIASVANIRFTTPAIDPLNGKSNPQLEVYLHYLSNTLEQFVFFTITLLTLSLYLNPMTIRIIPALTATFMLGRFCFLVGYLKNPLYRSFGMTMTLHPIMLTFTFTFFCVMSSLF
jgi:hypothetical protein